MTDPKLIDALVAHLPAWPDEATYCTVNNDCWSFGGISFYHGSMPPQWIWDDEFKRWHWSIRPDLSSFEWDCRHLLPSESRSLLRVMRELTDLSVPCLPVVFGDVYQIVTRAEYLAATNGPFERLATHLHRAAAHNLNWLGRSSNV